MVLRNTYKETEYSLFLPAHPLLKTSTHSLEECRATRKQQRPTSAAAPWKGEREINMGNIEETYTTDHRGLLAGKKVEAHGLKVMIRQAPCVFPKCLGRTRMYTDEKLCPQYGDLKNTMFKPIYRMRTPQRHSGKQLGLPVGFEPFLLKARADDGITRKDFPARYNTYDENTFTTWFTKSMAAINVSAEASHTRLEIMRRRERQEGKLQDIKENGLMEGTLGAEDTTAYTGDNGHRSLVACTDEPSCQVDTMSLHDRSQRARKFQQEIEIKQHLYEI